MESLPANTAAAEISNRVVRVIQSYTGRGPTKSRTYVHEDLITVLLQDTLTKGERTLVAGGQTELVLSVRRAFQDSMRDDLVEVVQSVTGRTVTASFSASHLDPDAAVVVFMLGPVNGTRPA